MIRSFCSQWRDIITFIIRKEFSKFNKTNAGSNGLEPWPGLVLLRICLAQGIYTLWRSSRQGLTRLLLRGDLVSNWSQKVPLHIHSLAEGRDVPSPESWINAQLLCTLPPKGGQHAQQKEWKSKIVRRCELQRESTSVPAGHPPCKRVTRLVLCHQTPATAAWAGTGGPWAGHFNMTCLLCERHHMHHAR